MNSFGTFFVCKYRQTKQEYYWSQFCSCLQMSSVIKIFKLGPVKEQ